MQLYCAWLHLITPLLTAGDLLSPVTVIPALYGTDMILDCSFASSPPLNDPWLVITWQQSKEGQKDVVVHSYYYGRDQLERQGKVYRNRTLLFPEKFPQGNASLRLMDIRVQDGGLYICTVSTKMHSSTTKLQLEVAASYRDPQLTIAIWGQKQSSVTLKVVTGGGYPEAKVWWINQTGNDVIVPNNTTQMPDSQGLYNIISQLTVPVGQHTQYMFVLAHSVLNKNVTLPVTLISEQPHIDGPSRSHNATLVSVIAVFIITAVVRACWVIFSYQNFEWDSKETQTEDVAAEALAVSWSVIS